MKPAPPSSPAIYPARKSWRFPLRRLSLTPSTGSIRATPVGCRRASVITGKYHGGVFCRLEDNLDCLCTYSPEQYDEDFHIGDPVIIVITKYGYDKKQVYGKIVSKW